MRPSLFAVLVFAGLTILENQKAKKITKNKEKYSFTLIQAQNVGFNICGLQLFRNIPPSPANSNGNLYCTWVPLNII